MKTYRLSSAGERFTGLCICTVLLLCMAFLVFALRTEPLSFIICVLAGLLVAAGLGFYVVNLFKAACVPHSEDSILEVKGIPDQVVFLSETVSLETASYKNGPMAVRTLIFKDAGGEVTATIPTFFTAHQGAQAEPLAMELAQVLGLEFKPSLEPWEYDKQKRREHQRELAEAEKTARREKFRALKAKLLRKTEAAKATPVISEKKASDSDSMEDLESDGINYDALDDEK